jgi:methylated-DNA-[protein]-cysteine S-methyltransferase
MESICIETQFGCIQVRAQADRIVSIDFMNLVPEMNITSNPLLLRAEEQLHAYCEQPQTVFDLPLKLRGTVFQLRVWHALQAIPAGEVRTYGDLAEQLGSSPRAIGGACRANPAPIIIPCHRVVSRRGMGGYSGETTGVNMQIKQGLLRHEGVELLMRAPI